MSDNQHKTRREDLAEPFIPLTAKVLPNVPFVKVDVVKQNDKVRAIPLAQYPHLFAENDRQAWMNMICLYH